MKFKGKNNFEILGDPNIPEWLESLHQLESQNETTISKCQNFNFFSCSSKQNNLFINSSKIILLWSGIGILTGFLSILLGEVILKNQNFEIEKSQFSLYRGILGGGLSYLTFELLNQIVKQYKSIDQENLPQNINLKEIILKGLLLTNSGIIIANLIVEGINTPQIQNDVIANTIGTAVIHGGIGVLNSIR